MSNLIERQSAIDEWKNDFKGYVNSINIPRDDYNGIMEYIDELPSAEPEIIRCNECSKWRAKYVAIDGKHVCDVFYDYTTSEDYCAWAERRTDEQSD